ncbi:hypothetical protein F4811DRAFT_511101 [Daldinia bambusicola]|nr:hypothetical protein F4811DRAFT_511101 [Daldinia bambusicola]
MVLFFFFFLLLSFWVCFKQLHDTHRNASWAGSFDLGLSGKENQPLQTIFRREVGGKREKEKDRGRLWFLRPTFDVTNSQCDHEKTLRYIRLYSPVIYIYLGIYE